MTREEAIAKLRVLKPQLEALGLRHVWLFGSVARDEATPDSDLDLLIDIEPQRYPSLWAKGTLQIDLAPEVSRLIGRPTDLLDRAAARQPLLDRIGPDLLRAF